jgi:putative flippase GtrA
VSSLPDDTVVRARHLEAVVHVLPLEPERSGFGRNLPIGQILRFGAVGGASYVFNLGTYSLGLWAGLDYLLAATISFLIGFVFNFFANRHWTFGSGGDQVGGQFVRFSCVAALVLGLDLVLLRGAVEIAGLHEVVAQGVVILFLAPLSFALNRLWSFAERPGS